MGHFRPSALAGQLVADDITMIATSYPEFFDHMAAIGADVAQG